MRTDCHFLISSHSINTFIPELEWGNMGIEVLF